jgi:hypothetical protein
LPFIPASVPDFFVEDTPTAVLVRQVLGAIAQFEKASLVATSTITDAIYMIGTGTLSPLGSDVGQQTLRFHGRPIWEI